MPLEAVIHIVITLFGMVLTAGIAYGAIRGDLKYLIKEAQRATDTANKAHERIDGMMADNFNHRKRERP